MLDANGECLVVSNTMSKQTTIAFKRKSDGSSAASKKKARSSAPSKDAHAAARELVAEINASPETFDLPDDDDDVRRALVSLAAYAKALEPAEKSSSQIATEVDRLRRTAVSGIKKQMTVSLNASPCTGYAFYCFLSHFDALYSRLTRRQSVEALLQDRQREVGL
jgi:hypothetical protein